MGGLHLAMNYLKAIGQHMTDTGLSEIWKESDLLADGSILKVFDGKAYAKAMRAHKLTFQAMWRILIPRLLSFIQQRSDDLHSILTEGGNDVENLAAIVKSEEFSSIMTEFVKHESSQNNNFKFWWTYVDSVSTLLLFTRSIRDGTWDLYLYSLKSMIPLMERYNHRNYVISVTIFIAQMNQLPDGVKLAFEYGDFVVKTTEGKFNQVDADHAQEWMVGVSKDSGGIVGITQKENTLQRWALSFGWRTEITQKTFAMYGLITVAGVTNEATAARRARDSRDEDSLLRSLTYFNVFAPIQYSGIMQNIVTKDVATETIQNFLLNVAEDGEKQVLVFVNERLIGDKDAVRISLEVPLKQNIVASMKTLYEPTSKKETQPQQKTLKVHGNMIQRLVMAFEAGRVMNLEKMLEHELQEYPLALVEPNGQLRSGNPLDINVLVKPQECCVAISNLKSESHLIVSGDAMFAAIPKYLKTFNDLAESFRKDIDLLAKDFSRIDIVFNQKANLLKSDICSRKTKMPIRRIIENGDVALPKQWQTFIALPENKEDLYKFLSSEMARTQFDGIDLVLAGYQNQVFSPNSNICTEQLTCTHNDEAIRITLHAVNTGNKVVVVHSSDSNIFVLLIHHFERMKCEQLWLRHGSSKKPIYAPIHTICSRLPEVVKQNILAFDAITGSSITSFIAGITKNTGWNIYLENAGLLSGIHKSNLTENAIRSAEEFVVKLYKLGKKATTTNSARYILFGAVNAPEFLPPTTDAVHQHIKRSHYQSMIWENIPQQQIDSNSPLSSGWKTNNDGKITPLLTTLEPITNTLIEMATCGCKGECANLRCSCVKNKMPCTALCSCMAVCKNPKISVNGA